MGMRGFLYWSAYNDIAKTLRVDAAPGRVLSGDASACGNALAKASRDAAADPALFMLATRQLIASAHASATCRVTCADPAWRETSLGFRVRRDGEWLYVTSATAEPRLSPGMRVAAVGRERIPELLRDMGADVLGGRGTDLEDWDLTLRMFDDMDVFTGDGHVERLDLRRYPIPAQDATTVVTEPRAGVALVRVGSLADPDALGAGLAAGTAAIERAAHVIVDLRDCAGDLVPASALAILPILCDRDVAARAVLGDRRVWTIYSRANVERLVALLERAREAAPEAARGEAQGYIDEIRAKGAAVLKAKRATLDARERRAASELPEVVPSPFDGEVVRVVAPAARVTLLVGPRTGVGAERLADAVRGMARVRLVGAQTPGALDYDTMLTADYPDVGVRLTYPISRSDASHEGRGYALTGLPLDVRVPFTPEACVRDVTLVAALA